MPHAVLSAKWNARRFASPLCRATVCAANRPRVQSPTRFSYAVYWMSCVFLKKYIFLVRSCRREWSNKCMYYVCTVYMYVCMYVCPSPSRNFCNFCLFICCWVAKLLNSFHTGGRRIDAAYHWSVGISPLYKDELICPLSAKSCPLNTTTDGSGGWFDAGDYGKYIATATVSVW